jgi:alanyl-tRNA synthetase
MRSEKLASADFHLLRAIAERLSCSPEEAPAAIEKSIVERDSNSKALRVAIQHLAETRSKLLITNAQPTLNGVRRVTQLLREENPDLLLPLATELAKNEKALALLIHQPTGQLVFAQSPGLSTDLGAVLKQVTAAIPGKGGGTRDFVRAKLADPSQAEAALQLATQFVSG